MYLSMILGATFIKIGASDFFEYVTATQIWGPCDNEKVNHLAFANEKGSHLWHISTPPCSNGVAQTVPELFLPPTVQKFSPVLRLSNVCRRPLPRSRLPVRVAPSTPRQVKAAQEEVGWGEGALVLALTGVAYLSSRTGGSYPLLGAGAACISAGSESSARYPCRSACCSR